MQSQQLHRTLSPERSNHRPIMRSLLAAAWCVLAAALPAGAATTSTEHFTDEPSATANGWTGFGNTANGQNFGFRATDLTGGASPAGEAGGTFVRDPNVAFYGDTTLGGTLTLNDAMHAEGELATANNNWDGDLRIGFFNTDSGGQTTLGNVLGLNLAEPGGGITGYRVSAAIIPANLTQLYSTPLDMSPLEGSFSFRFDYDPAGNGGNGSLVMEIFSGIGDSMGTRTINLSAAQRAAGANFNAFGFIIGGQGNAVPEFQLKAYLDAVSYTTVVASQVFPPKPVAGGWQVSFDGLPPGLTHQLQRAPHVTGPWQTLTTLNMGVTGEASFDDTSAPAERAFYRTVFP